MKLLADEFDHETGIITRVWLDEHTGVRYDEQLHDAQDVVDLAHAVASTEAPGRDIRTAAFVPELVLQQWMTAWLRGEGPHPASPEWEPWLKRKLNDPDNRRMRVHGGRL